MDEKEAAELKTNLEWTAKALEAVTAERDESLRRLEAAQNLATQLGRAAEVLATERGMLQERCQILEEVLAAERDGASKTSREFLQRAQDANTAATELATQLSTATARRDELTRVLGGRLEVLVAEHAKVFVDKLELPWDGVAALPKQLEAHMAELKALRAARR